MKELKFNNGDIVSFVSPTGRKRIGHIYGIHIIGDEVTYDIEWKDGESDRLSVGIPAKEIEIIA